MIHETTAPVQQPRNRNGIDAHYFHRKLGLLLRDFDSLTPDELARSLARLARTADSAVLSEPEFAAQPAPEQAQELVAVLRQLEAAGYIRRPVCLRRSDESCQAGIQLRHVLLYFPEVAIDAIGLARRALLLGLVELVREGGVLGEGVQEAGYVHVVHQRASDCVEEWASVRTLVVGDEQDVVAGKLVFGDVEDVALRVSPYAVRFCLDEEAKRLADRPAIQLFAAMGRDMLWHDAHAFVAWLAGHRLTRDEDGCLVLGHMAAEVGDVG